MVLDTSGYDNTMTDIMIGNSLFKGLIKCPIDKIMLTILLFFTYRNVVDDPLAAFERHLRERERQDRMKRNRARRSRSRSHSRPKSRPRSRPRSRSRSLSKKRSNSKSPLMRKDSPLLGRSSRTPPNILRRLVVLILRFFLNHMFLGVVNVICVYH